MCAAVVVAIAIGIGIAVAVAIAIAAVGCWLCPRWRPHTQCCGRTNKGHRSKAMAVSAAAVAGVVRILL